MCKLIQYTNKLYGNLCLSQNSMCCPVLRACLNKYTIWNVFT